LRQLILAFVGDALQRIAVCNGDIGGMLWIGNGKSLYLRGRSNLGRSDLRRDRSVVDGPLRPLVGWSQRVVLKGIDLRLDAVRDDHPGTSVGVDRQLHRAALKFWRAVHRSSTIGCNGPDMVRLQHLRGRAQ